MKELELAADGVLLFLAGCRIISGCLSRFHDLGQTSRSDRSVEVLRNERDIEPAYRKNWLKPVAFRLSLQSSFSPLESRSCGSSSAAPAFPKPAGP